MLILKKILLAPLSLGLIALMSVGPMSASAAGPMLAVGLDPLVITQNGPSATPNVLFGNILLNASGSTDNIYVSRIPFTLTTGGNASSGLVSNCQVYNTSTNGSLTTGGNVVSFPASAGGVSNFSFDTPLLVPANSSVTLALRCDIAASSALNDTYEFNLNPANVTATDATTGAVVTPVSGPGVPSSGSVITTTTPGTVSVIPGLPNTGVGGDASSNILLIGGAALVLILAAIYFKRSTPARM